MNSRAVTVGLAALLLLYLGLSYLWWRGFYAGADSALCAVEMNTRMDPSLPRSLGNSRAGQSQYCQRATTDFKPWVPGALMDAAGRAP